MAQLIFTVFALLVTFGWIGIVIYMAIHDEDVSIGEHRRSGKYRVLYNDGQISQPFMKRTAKNYAQMFGGKVVKKDYVV